ncbi:TPA: glycosyltransferase, partial [Streptococcus suis]
MEDIRSKSLLDVENIAILKIGSETKLEQDLLKLVEGQYLLSLNHIDDLDDRLLEKAIDSAEKYQSEIVLLENSIFDENDGNYYFYDKLFDEEILRAETVKGYFETSPRHQNYLTNNYAKLFKTSYVKENHINLTQDFTPETYNSDKISYVKENLYVYKKIKEELVSVIVPVYNVENYLSQCLDSIIHQTYKNLEIILVNDGSTDGSGKICDDYAAKDGRIKVIHQENGGLSDARNKGLDLMTGQFVTFVDSDDYLENNCIHTLYTYACTCKTD